MYLRFLLKCICLWLYSQPLRFISFFLYIAWTLLGKRQTALAYNMACYAYRFQSIVSVSGVTLQVSILLNELETHLVQVGRLDPDGEIRLNYVRRNLHKSKTRYNRYYFLLKNGSVNDILNSMLFSNDLTQKLYMELMLCDHPIYKCVNRKLGHLKAEPLNLDKLLEPMSVHFVSIDTSE